MAQHSASGSDPLRTLSLSNLSKRVNNMNLDEEIIVFRFEAPADEAVEPSDMFPTRFDGLLLFMLDEGTAEVAINMEQYALTPSTLLTLGQHHYVRSFRLNPGARARGVACSRAILDMVLPKPSDIVPVILEQSSRPFTHLSPTDATAIRAFHDFIAAKLAQPRSYFLKQKIICILKATLYELMDARITQVGGASRQLSREKEIMARFLAIVADNFKTVRRISFYADQLCISVKHLSAVVKKTSGRTPGEWIEQYVIMEAKVLLRTTDLSIQQISTALNFSHQGFFGKYFRYRTGMSPSAFRLGNI